MTLVQCLETQFWNEKKIYYCRKKTSRSYDVLKCSSEMKKRIYCCRKKHHARTMSWNAVLKWKKEFTVVEKNNAIVWCLETQFWDEKKIYCCRKKHCDRTMSWNAVLKWKEKFILVEKNITIVRCLEMQFWDEKKNLLLSKKKHHVRTMFWNAVLRWNKEFIVVEKKTSRSYKILKRNFEMNNIHWY
jgi:uncharacterized pyridoxamine 5'-phosphate oxidase family protein